MPGPATPSIMEYLVVPESLHDRRVEAAFHARGFDEVEVAGMVRVCREAARHGIRTHNAIKAVELDDRFGSRVGGCVPRAAIEELPARFPAARIWNAHRKSGPTVAWAAIETCLDLAAKFGVGTVSVDDAWHYLWGGAYVLEAARRGFIGYTNCTSMLAEVVPFGGRHPTLGTNPHSWAFPTVDSLGFPVLVDFATSAIAMGRVQQLAREGRDLPPSVALDAAGEPTTDPSLVRALLPFGGHKGYGLALVDELFAAIVGGGLPTRRGRFGGTAGDDDTKRTPCFFFQAIHPEALSGQRHEGGSGWQANVKRVIEDILGSGNEGAVLPGQPEARAARASAEAGGLLFSSAELDAFDAFAAGCGEPPWNRAAFKRIEWS